MRLVIDGNLGKGKYIRKILLSYHEFAQVQLAVLQFATRMQLVGLYDCIHTIECLAYEHEGVHITVQISVDEVGPTGGRFISIESFTFPWNPTSPALVRLLNPSNSKTIVKNLQAASAFGDNMYQEIVHQLVSKHKKRTGCWEKMYTEYVARKKERAPRAKKKKK